MVVRGSGPKKKYVSILQKSTVLGTAEIAAGKKAGKTVGQPGSGHKRKHQGCHYMEYELSYWVNSGKNGKVLN